MSDAPKTSKTGRLGCLVGAAGLVGLIVVAWIVGKQAMDKVDEARAACTQAAVPNAAAYEPGGSQHIVGFVRTSQGDWMLSSRSLPGSFPEATTTAEASLVACLEPSRSVLLERCSYQGGHNVDRFVDRQRVRVVAPRTGALVREIDVDGGAPAPCPETFATGGGGGGFSVRVLGIPVASVGGDTVKPTADALMGAAISAADFERALGDLVLKQ